MLQDRERAVAVLPPPLEPSALRGLGWHLATRPLLDRLAPQALRRLLLPLARGIAAALEAAGDPARFAASSGLGEVATRRLKPFLEQRKAHAERYRGAERRWEESFFGDAEVGAADLVEAEATRRDCAIALLGGGRGLLPWVGRLAPLRWDVPGPEAMDAATGGARAVAERAFAPYRGVEVETSRAVTGAWGREYFLRLRSPGLGDPVVARVYEPLERPVEASLVFLHGVCMETEFWPDFVDPINALTARGLRVIRPEAPWHGRRRRPGWYGGEPFLGRGPLGALELFEAWAGEAAVLIAWARGRGGGAPVALGGLSLGALTAQRAVVAARDWPAEARPDALFLTVTTGGLEGVALTGALGWVLETERHLRAAGWDRAALAPWLAVLEPRGDPCLPAGRIVMLLGRQDRITPFAGGRALAETWSLPAENLFLRYGGHFVAPLGLLHDPRPLDRLVELLKA